MPHRPIAIVVYPGVEVLDATGPASVFANANAALPAGDRYAITMLAARAGPVPTSSGLALHADADFAHAPRRLDTLLVAGGDGTRAAIADAAFIGALRRLAGRARRVASVCSGAFLLAQAGILDGKRATTHWRQADLLRRMFPRVAVEPDAIFVTDGEAWTSAGVTAGLDLALALIEADHGPALALAIARELVFYVKRPGGQSQFSVPLATPAPQSPVIDRLRRHVLEHPQADLSLVALAERAHVSERHLRRLFRRELAIGPREFVQRARLERAQQLLCESRASVREIARRCGYATAESLARPFEARLGITPAAYRARFRRH